MGKISVTRVYHIGLPVNDIKRAEKFYVDVLGMTVMGRGSGVRENNRPFYEMLGYWPEVLRLACSKDNKVEVVLFERGKPVERDRNENGFCHTGLSASSEDFDRALGKLKEWGVDFQVGPIIRNDERTLYFYDPEGNLLQLDDRGS
jgi:catechol 2,3-dioxygenase-like lactoylglutathione lyase family enzyme